MAKLIDFIFIILFLHKVPTSCQGHHLRHRRPGNRAALFIFGDSVLDPGNNNYINTSTLDQANFWPYGITYFHRPTGRFSDGNCQFYDGANFASAGAGALVETFPGQVVNLGTQLKYFKKAEKVLRGEMGDGAAKTILSDAVYLVSIGNNDYISPFLTNSSPPLLSYSKSQFVAMVIGNLTTVVKEIYKSGGRKFGFLNVGPLGCLPGLRILKPHNNKGGCLASETSKLGKLHNEVLSKLLPKLHHQFQGFKYSLLDVHSGLLERMNNPSKYGLKEGKSACCGSGQFGGVFSCGGRRPVKKFHLCGDVNKHLFWDSYHLTERVYRQLADQMWSGKQKANPNDMPGFYNLEELFR
ncbi:GDSL esterase/lipase 5-like isoform X2 [Malania oleifera]|uniref:GDSL esterase/lipase 5-like isoform X2 n=1 Tax=Malania oleifera TaxID=397392 RepID=UPI0025AE5B95|nr:GDSL esterase/lipase 5-like isoform X2 [Malania oleifera]